MYYLFLITIDLCLCQYLLQTRNQYHCMYFHNPNQIRCHQIQISCHLEFYPIIRTRFECFWILRDHVIITNKNVYTNSWIWALRSLCRNWQVNLLPFQQKSINMIYKKHQILSQIILNQLVHFNKTRKCWQIG